MKKRIIDAHSHIGVDRFFRFQGKLQEYVEECKKIGVTDSLLMPTPCPVISCNGKSIVPFVWEYTKQHFSFYQEEIEGKRTAVEDNPYCLANKLLQSSIKHMKNIEVNLLFVPLVHPKYDTIEYLDMLLQNRPIAIKLHGISSAFSPYDVSNEFWSIIRKYDIPIIVHTDYDNTDNNTPLTKLRNLNCPLDWIKVFTIQHIRALLTHGVRLCYESCKIINESDNFIVGIGPDSLISSEKERLYRNDDYLKTLFSMVDINKLVFDIDYPWNIKDNHLDFNSINRIKSLNLSDSDFNKVLCTNAIRFFNI